MSSIECGGDIGQRADRDQGHFSRIFSDDPADKFRRRLGDWFGLGLGENSSSQSILAVRVGRRDQTSQQRRLGAGSNRNVGAARYFHHAQGVGKTQFERNISGDRGNAFNLQLRRPHGEQQGQRVVYAWVGVNDHAKGSAIGPLICCPCSDAPVAWEGRAKLAVTLPAAIAAAEAVTNCAASREKVASNPCALAPVTAIAPGMAVASLIDIEDRTVRGAHIELYGLEELAL